MHHISFDNPPTFMIYGLKLEQWPDTLQFGLTQFGVADHLFELEVNGSEVTVFDEDVHVVFIKDVTN